MRIHLDELTCPVCGIVHSDHIINGPAAFYDVIWEETICDACDSWAWLIEAEIADLGNVVVGDAKFRRARAAS